MGLFLFGLNLVAFLLATTIQAQTTASQEDSVAKCLRPSKTMPEVKIKLGVLNSKALELPKPEYPAEAKAANVTGTIKADIVIEEGTGNIIWARLRDGHLLLQEAVSKVVCKARFAPLRYTGPPIRISGILEYKFEIKRTTKKRKRG